MKLRILAMLLHHANRISKDDRFYAIKDSILHRHAKLAGRNVQVLEGKQCFTCSGSGVYVGYHPSGDRWQDDCRRCWGTGWYKDPRYVFLTKYELEGFFFHRPTHVVHSLQEAEEYNGAPLEPSECILGFVDHRRSKHGKKCLLVLALLYDHELAKRTARDMWFWYSNGWPAYWYQPRNWLKALAHLLKYQMKAIPVKRLLKR